MTRWLRPGDWLVLSLLAAASAYLAVTLWSGGHARTVLIKRHGELFREASLLHDRIVAVPGPLGVTEVEIAGGRTRIRSDPSPRQYCVKQGWLTRAGQVAICLPNATSIELAGGERPYDSLQF
ncbi:NusG domain II-containing protein [Crenobacter cavernae]|uniref:NusG domain II-containing protein n=1 Tax=Crenobacter cavernae TaxID=2290923 RepID=A0ABY0FJM4_9NEIS|nr:NusG domain II-containing protein [Crenobacter cavernae]RXZ45643.1 hypothetical protein EBB06_02195 [Crenobacter cavernae]